MKIAVGPYVGEAQVMRLLKDKTLSSLFNTFYEEH